jgi:hypothetical protein
MWYENNVSGVGDFEPANRRGILTRKMTAVWQAAGCTPLRCQHGKIPSLKIQSIPPHHNYDQSVAIWPQITIPVWKTSPNPYDPNSAVFTMSKKSVTNRLRKISSVGVITMRKLINQAKAKVDTTDAMERLVQSIPRAAFTHTISQRKPTNPPNKTHAGRSALNCLLMANRIYLAATISPMQQRSV